MRGPALGCCDRCVSSVAVRHSVRTMGWSAGPLGRAPTCAAVCQAQHKVRHHVLALPLLPGCRAHVLVVQLGYLLLCSQRGGGGGAEGRREEGVGAWGEPWRWPQGCVSRWLRSLWRVPLEAEAWRCTYGHASQGVPPSSLQALGLQGCTGGTHGTAAMLTHLRAQQLDKQPNKRSLPASLEGQAAGRAKKQQQAIRNALEPHHTCIWSPRKPFTLRSSIPLSTTVRGRKTDAPNVKSALLPLPSCKCANVHPSANQRSMASAVSPPALGRLLTPLE